MKLPETIRRSNFAKKDKKGRCVTIFFFLRSGHGDSAIVEIEKEDYVNSRYRVKSPSDGIKIKSIVDILPAESLESNLSARSLHELHAVSLRRSCAKI